MSARPFEKRGVGLHTGEPATLRVLPGPPGSGIALGRKGGPARIPISLASVKRTRRATTLGSGEVEAATVEHLLAAAAGLGVADALFELDGPEVPILDGSALPWVEAFVAHGFAGEPAWRSVPAPVEVRQADRLVRIEPSDRLVIEVTVEFDENVLGRQHREWVYDRGAFAADIAPARTLGRVAEIEKLKAQGLIRGGSLDCALVAADDRYLNPEGPRFADEPVRHRILDALGDLFLWSAPRLPLARVTIRKAGHAHLIAALRRLGP